jgi:hypothetical protein
MREGVCKASQPIGNRSEDGRSEQHQQELDDDLREEVRKRIIFFGVCLLVVELSLDRN